MPKSSVLSFTVPSEIKQILEAAGNIGYYDSLSEFLRDSIRNLLENKKDLRIAIAYDLYKKNKISIGKAAEIIQTSVQETQELFKDREK